ncbi:helix-turn-helix domain-containing protein [Cupriavidus respiraculi]|uniref:helix-turn-helix domain-containing protein n=1 Tax=Cupriavidus respiraculi TaxID=195930 RepID=UPI001F4084E1|nr:helix-turn-helix domain-containing protein [Cupriavidus respiraculi]
MSLREVDRFKVIQAVAEGLLPQWRAAERLNLTTRQVSRLIQRRQDDGPMGLVSRQRGQPGHHQLPRQFEAHARAVIQAHYADYRPTLACERIFTWREWRKVSNRLTLQYDRLLYLIADDRDRRMLIDKYIEVAEYPDGRIQLWADGASLPYVLYGRLSDVDQGAIVENKRLGQALRIAQRVQEMRDNRRIETTPSRTLLGQPPKHRPGRPLPGTKSQRQLNEEDLRRVIKELAPPPHPVDAASPTASTTVPRKPGKRRKTRTPTLH